MGKQKVVALVTLYHPDAAVAEKVSKIFEQADQTYLCDNSSQDHRALFGEGNYVYLPLLENRGLPGAFNSVLQKEAQFEEDDLILFFDQDSRIDDGYIDRLVEEYQLVERQYGNLGCLGPVFFNTSNQTLESPRMKKQLTEHTYQVSNIITSSMMTRYGNLKAVDFWNENLFLDFADWDLCWRMEQAGMICCITDKVQLTHSVGSGEKKVGPIHLRVGQPFREYYQTRDALYLLKERYVPLKMRLRLWANVVIRPMVHYLFLDQGKERLAFVKKGKQDYRKGIRGEYHQI